MMPGWFHYLMIVKPDGRDVVVKYVRVAPNQFCDNVVTVQADEVRLHDTAIADLIKDNNPCAISASRVRQDIRKHSHRAAVDDDTAFGVVAQCGGKQIVHHFPYGAVLDAKKLQPEVRRLRELSWDIQRIAFGDRDVFYKTSPEEDEKLQAGGSAIVDELRTGKFDKGFPYKASFVDDLKDYVGTVLGNTQQSGELEHADSYRFRSYVPALYPPLALQARIQGKVQLDLDVDARSGVVNGVSVVAGHGLLKPSAIYAAKQWRFEPNSVEGKIRVVVDFEFRCPTGGASR